MDDKRVNEIMEDITDDSSLCTIRNALESFDEEGEKTNKITEGLRDVYNNNKLNEADECNILNALTYLGYDIQML